MYDTHCEDLARHFLPSQADPTMIKTLAQHIQDAVESWLEYEANDLAQAIAQYNAKPTQ